MHGCAQVVGDNGCSQLMQRRGVVGVNTCTSFLSLYSLDETHTMKTVLWLHDFDTFKKLTEAHIVLYARVFVRVFLLLVFSQIKYFQWMVACFMFCILQNWLRNSKRRKKNREENVEKNILGHVLLCCHVLQSKNISDWSRKGGVALCKPMGHSLPLFALMEWLHNITHHPASRLNPDSIISLSCLARARVLGWGGGVSLPLSLHAPHLSSQSSHRFGAKVTERPWTL